MELVGLIIVIAIIAAYYGVFENVEVASNMATTELKDAQRKQKIRIVKGNQTMGITDKQYKDATANIAKIDALEI